jgi:hypothetical protein
MYDGKSFGLNVHQPTISAVVVDLTIKLMMQCVLETKPTIIPEYLQALRGSLHVTFEGRTSAA